jgi:hypothetical protein
MSRTISDISGDGISTPLIRFSMMLPETGAIVPITGSVESVGNPIVTLTGSPITVPIAPATGLIYYILQANTTTGAVTVKQSVGAMPTADALNQQIFSTILQTTDLNPALDADNITPDTY